MKHHARLLGSFVVGGKEWNFAVHNPIVTPAGILKCPIQLSIMRRSAEIGLSTFTHLQVKEVLDFSVAILPSVILSVIMHTLSLVPSILYINDLLGYPTTCLIYFSVRPPSCNQGRFPALLFRNTL